VGVRKNLEFSVRKHLTHAERFASRDIINPSHILMYVYYGIILYIYIYFFFIFNTLLEILVVRYYANFLLATFI